MRIAIPNVHFEFFCYKNELEFQIYADILFQICTVIYHFQWINSDEFTEELNLK